MSPNYLQRIAIAGSSTSAMARPVASGPPQMPGLVWSSGVSIPADRASPPPGGVEGEQRQSRLSFDIERVPGVGLARDLQREVDMKRSSETEHAADIEPVPAGESMLTGRYATSVAQKGTPPRPRVPEEPQGAEDSLLPRPESELVISAPKGLRPVLEPPPTEATEPAGNLPSDDESDWLATQAAVHSVLQPHSASVVRAPAGLRPVLKPPPAAPNEPTILPRPSRADSRTLAAKGPLPTQMGIQPRPRSLNGDDAGSARAPSPAAVEPITSDDLEATRLRVRSPHPMPELVEAVAPLSDSATPPTQVVVPARAQGFIPISHWLPVMPPDPLASTRSESRITIGRIEVQVNNRLPQAPVESRHEPVRVSLPASPSLEAHYLDRFFLRP
jgi:hypothetical protein